jgi:hypothetical protein
MVIGATVMAAGLGIRVGAIPITFGGGSGDLQPSGGLASGGPGATPAGALASPAPQATPAPTATAATAAPPTAPPTPTPAPEAGTPWFADDFDAVAAWPVGPLDWLTADVAGGQYHIVARPTDLPVFVMAAAGEGSPGPMVRVTALLAISASADPATGAGVSIEDVAGARLLAMVSPDGRVTLFRDSIESLDLLASGSISPPSGVVELTLSLDAGTAAVSIDGIQVASARATLSTMGVGLAVWAVGGPAAIDVDAYRVWAGSGAAPP